MKDLLKRYFGFDDFRPLQAEVIDAVMDGRDSLVVMPTGGGKSLCYQLPALALPGVALVVSPLIALMKDQVDALKGIGAAADLLNSATPHAERTQIQLRAYNGDLRLLYVAPERVAEPRFQDFLRALNLSLIAVDEAHCISEWGHEFRPDYRSLARIRQIAPSTPIIALTATATQRVREDIERQLDLRAPSRFLASFDRPNLSYAVKPSGDRYDELVAALRECAEGSAIVYRSSRKGVDELVGDLAEDGIEALPYHAGLDADVRAANQERFVRDETRVIVATVAFGMGIDKPDVRLVAHYEMPSSIERLYQESGRAGRDGLPARSIVYFGARDRERQTFFLDRMEDDTERAAGYERLNAMLGYCQGAECRRAGLLAYFGETFGADSCDACDVCEADTFDATTIAQKILSAVIRTGERFGAAYVSQVLRGAMTRQTEERGHRQLSVFGIVGDYSDSALRDVMAMLVSRGLLSRGVEYPTLAVTASGRAFLRDRASLTLPTPAAAAAKPQKARVPAAEVDYDGDLFEKLRELRTGLARERGVPPYVVFGDVTLRGMASRFPQSEASLLDITGVGQKKLRDYGAAFLEVIRLYANENGLDDRTLALRERGEGMEARIRSDARAKRYPR